MKICRKTLAGSLKNNVLLQHRTKTKCCVPIYT